MNKIEVCIEKDDILSKVDERLFGSFIEHLGRAVYSGIYEKDHPTSDAQGFRQDVIELVRELRVPLIRYPGGNFLSGYDWTDGIGPVEKRPSRLDLAWKTIEPNLVGIDEFYDWTVKAGSKIMGAVNMGTGTPKDAGNMLEYCNFSGGTHWSDMRKANGHAAPFSIKTWCLGNEMDGPWQICHLDAVDYGKKARETAKIMKWIDDTIELVVAGSSSSLLPTFPEWDRLVLEHTYDQVDYISLHHYYENLDNDADFLASFFNMDTVIKSVCATADYVKALKRSRKTMRLSFDEWNVWYQRRMSPPEWPGSPGLLEDQYSLMDALVVGGLGITLLNNADRVGIACLAQLVNVIAPIYTRKGGGVIRQSTFYPFKDISLYGRGTALSVRTRMPTRETCHGDAPVAAIAAVYDEEERVLTLFAMNTDLENESELNLDLRSFGESKMLSRTVLAGSNVHAVNTFESPDVVSPKNVALDAEPWGCRSIRIEPASWNVIQFKVKG